MAVLVAGSAVCALAANLPQLIAGRIVHALEVCATSVLSRAIARDLFDGEMLARALSLIMVAMVAVPGFSPLLGGAFNSLLGWRATFWVVALLAMLLGIHYVIRLGETHAADRRAALSLRSVAGKYGRLLRDRRFIAPALSVMGIGMINPLGTAITLQPFGPRAGAASALLGFLQMGCAALAIGIASALAMPVHLAFCIVLAAGLALSLLAFFVKITR